MQYPRKQYMDKLIQKKDNGRINVETFSSSQGDTFVGSSAREGFAVSLKATDNTSQSRRSP